MALLESALLVALSTGTVAELGRVEALFSRSPTARRLLAETAEVPRRRLVEEKGPAVRYDELRGVLVFNTRELKRVTELELQLALARELARASIGLPLEVVEVDMAAYQEELSVAAELDEPRLKRALAAAEKSAAALKASHRWQRERVGLEAGRAAAFSLPADEVERCALLVVLFRGDADDMYWAIEGGRDWPHTAVRAVELEDFLTLHAGTPLPEAAPDAPYVRVKGRRYRPALVAAAKRLQELGGLARLREALGSFETRPIPELRSKLNDWSRR